MQDLKQPSHTPTPIISNKKWLSTDVNALISESERDGITERDPNMDNSGAGIKISSGLMRTVLDMG